MFADYLRFGDVVSVPVAANSAITGDALNAKTLILTGTLSGSSVVYLPHASDYYIDNRTNVQITIKGASAETGVVIAIGATSAIFSDGSEWKSAGGSSGVALNIHGLTQKSALVPDDEFVVYDSVAATNKRATLTNVEESLFEPVIDTLYQRIGVGHRWSIDTAPTMIHRGIGDGISMLGDVPFVATPDGLSWRFSQRRSQVSNGDSVTVALGYIYADASFTKCPRLGGILTVETSTRDTTIAVKIDTYFLSAGYTYVAPSTYAQDVDVKAMSTAESGVTVGALVVNNGSAISGGTWYVVSVDLENASGATADIKFDWNASSCW